MNDKPNYKRMMSLIDEVFETRNDDNQIQVNKQELKKLTLIHPLTLTEVANEDGPVIWLLVIPTTAEMMYDFLSSKISEKQLLALTPLHTKYNVLYLCSVTTLPEYSGKGKTYELCINTINAIAKEHPIEFLLVWPFTKAGEALAIKIANASGLKLLTKK